MFTIPDKGEPDNDIQSILFQEYIDVLVAGLSGVDCVLAGLGVTGGADMTPAVAKGAVLTNGVMKAVAAADVTIGTADATNPRIDLIVVNASGALAVRAGTAAAAPKPPARTANDVVLAAVYVPANDTTIGAGAITDMRVMRTQGPILIYKHTTAETTNTTSAAIEALNKANSGVTIPNGLFLSGRILRVRLGGNILLNSGTPTFRFQVLYGGTTMYDNITTAATVNDGDRSALFLEFDIAAQANNDQAMAGHIQFTDMMTARPTPTTGIGATLTAGAGVPEGPTPFAGAAAVDSDAADRLLSVRFTFSVSNSLNELVIEYATVELI